MKNVQQESSVAIIGCGWLGLALAKALIADNIEVLATTTDEKKLPLLAKQNIAAEVLSLPQNNIEILAEQKVFSQSHLIICIPPKLKQGLSNYPEKISQIVSAAEIGSVKHIILISTTAVYGGLEGSVDEASSLDVTINKVKVLTEAEQAVLAFTGKANVLRLAGLVGPERHPGRFFKGNRKLASPNISVNLIHQQDAVGLIRALLLPSSPYGIFNGVSNTHDSKKEFYQAAASVFNSPLPLIGDSNNQAIDKQVKGEKAKKQLHYQFVYDDLLTWLKQ